MSDSSQHMNGQLPLVEWAQWFRHYVSDSDLGLGENVAEWSLIALGTIVVLGTILGWKARRIIVYRDVADVALSLALASAPLLTLAGYYFIFGGPDGVDASGPVGWLASLATPVLLLIVVFRTSIDNPNPVYLVIALITKTVLGILSCLVLIEFILPNPETKEGRPNNRKKSLFGLALLALLLFNLIASQHKRLLPGSAEVVATPRDSRKEFETVQLAPTRLKPMALPYSINSGKESDSTRITPATSNTDIQPTHTQDTDSDRTLRAPRTAGLSRLAAVWYGVLIGVCLFFLTVWFLH